MASPRSSSVTMLDFGRRSNQSELMDTEVVDFALFHQCLQQLEIVNILSLAYRPTLRWLRQTLSEASPGEKISILDVGSGGGDMLRIRLASNDPENLTRKAVLGIIQRITSTDFPQRVFGEIVECGTSALFSGDHIAMKIDNADIVRTVKGMVENDAERTPGKAAVARLIRGLPRAKNAL